MLKWVFEWCRIHIETVLALHYSLVVFYPILLWFTYAWFIQANPVQVGPGPPKSAQVNPNTQVLPQVLHRFSTGSPQVLPGSPQVLPGSPRKLVISCDFVGFRDFLGGTWVLFSAILWGLWDFLGEPGCSFLRFCGVSGISWENLGGNSWGWAWESCKS